MSGSIGFLVIFFVICLSLSTSFGFAWYKGWLTKFIGGGKATGTGTSSTTGTGTKVGTGTGTTTGTLTGTGTKTTGTLTSTSTGTGTGAAVTFPVATPASGTGTAITTQPPVVPIPVCDPTACNGVLRDWIVNKYWAFDNSTVQFPQCAACPTRAFSSPNQISKNGGAWVNYPSREDAYAAGKI